MTPSQVVDEEQGSVEVCVTVDGMSEIDVAIEITSRNGSAGSKSTNYTHSFVTKAGVRVCK